MNETEDYNRNFSHSLRMTKKCDHRDFEEVTKIAMTFSYSLLLIIAFLGNAFVISVARRRLTVRNPFNILIINLSVCDILYATTAVTIQVYYIFFRISWFPGGFGIFLCKMKEFAFVLSIATSILTLTFMAIEKHLAILYVMKTPLSTRNVCRAILFIWLVSSVIASTELIKLTVVLLPNQTHVSCFPMWSRNDTEAYTFYKVEYTIRFFLLFVFPLLVMIVLYGRIIRYLWQRQLPGNRSNKNERKIRMQSRRAVLMLVTMTVVFAVGWFPVHVNHYLIFYEQLNFCLPHYLILVLYWMAHANCAVNPCLYLIFNKDYNDEFKKLFKCHGRYTLYRQRCGTIEGADGLLRVPAMGSDTRRESIPLRTRSTTFRKH